VVVVSGEYDRVQDVLKEVGVPHIVVSPMALARTPLNAKQLLIINCAGSLGPQELEKVRKFVNAGGFLYTTDWALTRVKETSSSNLLKHLHMANANPKWWLAVAEAKTGGAYLKEDAKLSKKAAEALANDVDVKGSQAGDIQSAYAVQQMTSNLVIERMGR